MIRGVFPSITATAEFVVPELSNKSVTVPINWLRSNDSDKQHTQVDADDLALDLLIHAS